MSKCEHCHEGAVRRGEPCFRCGHIVGEAVPPTLAAQPPPRLPGWRGYANDVREYMICAIVLLLILFGLAIWAEVQNINDAANSVAAARGSYLGTGANLGVFDYIEIGGHNAGYLAAAVACLVGYWLAPLVSAAARADDAAA